MPWLARRREQARLRVFNDGRSDNVRRGSRMNGMIADALNRGFNCFPRRANPHSESKASDALVWRNGGLRAGSRLA